MSAAIDWRRKSRKPRPDLAERNRQRATHGLSGSPIRKSWETMVRRCTVPSDGDYGNYGARGITVCAEWLADFEAFVRDLGPRPEGATLGRINNDGNYEPSNCRWETPVQQCNNRRSNRFVTAFGRTQTVALWARERGMSAKVLRYRLEAGWSPELAVSTQVQPRTRKA